MLEPGFAFAGRVVSLIGDQRITALSRVPTVFGVLLSLRGLEEREFPELCTLTNAGAPMPEPMIQSLRLTFPNARFYSMYGQTEAQRIRYLPPDQLEQRLTSVGVPIPGTEAWIEDADGNVPVPGAVGEPMVRGTHVMLSTGTNPRRRRRSCARALAVGAGAGDRRPLPDRRGGLPVLRQPARRHHQVARREGGPEGDFEDLLHTVPEVREGSGWSGSPTSCSARR